MPKTKGMTSLEIAIIVAIILVIAIAVGWYLYNTFASAGQRSTLGVQVATVYAVGQQGSISQLLLYLQLQPSSPGQSVEITGIEIGGKVLTCTGAYITKPGWYMVDLLTKFEDDISQNKIGPGQILSGRILLRDGGTVLFNARIELVSQDPKLSQDTLNCE